MVVIEQSRLLLEYFDSIRTWSGVKLLVKESKLARLQILGHFRLHVSFALMLHLLLMLNLLLSLLFLLLFVAFALLILHLYKYVKSEFIID